eukprot:4994384-Amphidinium_carterae.1
MRMRESSHSRKLSSAQLWPASNNMKESKFESQRYTLLAPCIGENVTQACYYSLDDEPNLAMLLNFIESNETQD